MRSPPSGTSVMCTQPVDSGTSTSVPGLRRGRCSSPPRRRRGCRSSARPATVRQRKSGSIQAPSSRSVTCAAHEAALRQVERPRLAGAHARPARARSGRKRTTHSSCRPPGWAVWNRPGRAGRRVGEDHRVLLRAVGIVRDPVGRAPGVGAGRQRREVDEDVRPALQRAAEPGAGKRAVRQPLQEGRVVVHDRRGQERLRPPGAGRARFVRSSAPRSRPGSFAPPPCVRLASDGQL